MARLSISQNPHRDALPDFRNLGVMVRILVAAQFFALAGVLGAADAWPQTVERFLHAAAFVEPLVLASIALLYVFATPLMRLPYWGGCLAILGTEVALTAMLYRLQPDASADAARAIVGVTFATAVLLGYFRLRVKAHSPALAEARLQALQARIRPHFLFNSLNAVLSLVRADPRRAERALEDLADLFRTLMADAGRFTRLADEIALLERYAAIEALRLGERLQIAWELDRAPVDALLPPLVLQPLLENAIYHGAEPASGSAEILVRIGQRGDHVIVRIENPWHPDRHASRSGNRLALENISERLMLFFDADGRIESRVEGTRYIVEVVFPYHTNPPEHVSPVPPVMR